MLMLTRKFVTEMDYQNILASKISIPFFKFFKTPIGMTWGSPFVYHGDIATKIYFFDPK